MSAVNQSLANNLEEVAKEIEQLKLLNDNPEKLSEKLYTIISMLFNIDELGYSEFVLKDRLKLIPTDNMTIFSEAFKECEHLKNLE